MSHRCRTEGLCYLVCYLFQDLAQYKCEEMTQLTMSLISGHFLIIAEIITRARNSLVQLVLNSLIIKCELYCKILLLMIALKILGSLLLTWFNLFLTWISNYIHCKVWDEIIYPFPNFNGFHPTLYWIWNYLSMLWSKLNHVSKRGPCVWVS